MLALAGRLIKSNRKLLERIALLESYGTEVLMRQAPQLLMDAYGRGLFDDVEYPDKGETYGRRIIEEHEDGIAMLALNWNEGCTTPIHGHGWKRHWNSPQSYKGSWCFDLIMHGRQTSTMYEAKMTDDQHIWEVRYSEEKIATKGLVIGLPPGRDLHRVLAEARGSGRVQSIHIYRKNLTECVTFVPLENENGVPVYPTEGNPQRCAFMTRPLSSED